MIRERVLTLGLKVRMFSKQEEGGKTKVTTTIDASGKSTVVRETIIEAEGADWEWFVDGPYGCSASFRVQAKKLYPDTPTKPGYYGGFKPGGKQIKDLITRAKGSNPIYVLYTHPDTLDASLFGSTRQPDFFDRSCWGCAVTTAQFMKHVSNNRLATIKPGSIPWHRFFSIGLPCRPAEAMKEIASQVRLSEGDAPQEFVPARGRPEWVEALSSGERDLTSYLIEHQLQGVAHIDFSSSRG